ncbi:hypothetical protein C0J50_23108 [Silurus asotus]|uniref:NACHT domain-containing protein n=1 Tax=Silurus asotus TaxID=30991 RepID=A0AAD5AJK0_SILAS|nr:hypothetical protein C0J50_23108 [Silurus asotus]
MTLHTSPPHRHNPRPPAVNDFKLNLIRNFQWLIEVIKHQGTQTLLNEIYTDLYITEGDSGDIKKEQEVRKIGAETTETTTDETPIKCNDIFKLIAEEDKLIRTVLTKGIAGIGKTVSVQKFILDWAEAKENQDINLILPLPFRELNLMKEQKLSLMELLYVFFKEIKEIQISSLEKVLFIFDGLDECRFPLDFQNTVRVCDVSESASVTELLINLIKGNLLPSALIWITSRPAAADQIPSECVHRVTEIRGFNDPQKEEYFRKRISDQILANNIITHLKALRSLYIMCHIPVFCWISATVLERMLGEAESGEIPKTLTQMYTHFLIMQTKIIREKFPKKQESDEKMLPKLGKLAFQQLMKGNLIFCEEDLRVCGIDVTEAAVYSGVCTQIFRKEFVLHQSKVYCFLHLSIQEHLAALYVHLMFIKKKRNVFQYSFSESQISDVHKSAVDQALQSQTGHLDLFLCFLMGFSLSSNQNLINALVIQTGSSSQNIEKTVQYIKMKISEDLPTEKSINLFHCLNELGDHSLVEEIQRYLKSGQQSELSSAQWSALVFVLLTSAQDLEEFDQSKYISTDKITESVLLKLMPVIAASRKAMCNKIRVRSWSALVSMLSSETSNLRELHLTVDTLDLSGNTLGDSGVKSYATGLENPNFKMEILKLCDCSVSAEGFVVLTSALRSHPSHLRELDLSQNKLEDSGVKALSGLLENPDCKLETLRLNTCGVSDKGCAALASALSSNPSHLKELHLFNNKVEDSGVKCLSAILKNPHSKLVTLRLRDCCISDGGCEILTLALRSNPSHLRELDLSNNIVGDSGVKFLSSLLGNPHCALEKLWLCKCGVSVEGCAALTSALRSNPSHLRELDLTWNDVGDSGVKHLSAVLENPHCKLEILRLWGCGVSDEGCAALASALKSNPSHLKVLDLSCNTMQESGVRLLSAIRNDEHFKLEALRELSSTQWSALVFMLLTSPHELVEFDQSKYISTDMITESLLIKLMPVIAASRKAISETSDLRELHLTANTLDLTGNKLNSDVKCLSALLKNPHCKVKILRLCNCGVSDEDCAALTSALRSNPSHLRELDLSFNNIRDTGVKCLSAVLGNPRCKLETLSLSKCGVTDKGCATLTSALKSNPSHLRELGLSQNNVGDSGVKHLSSLMENPHFKLETLRLRNCGVTDKSCASLWLNPAYLRVLDLSWNNVGDSGLRCLSAVLGNPQCKLETLWLSNCGVSDEGCAALASALKSNPSHLRELDLSCNNVEDWGKRFLSNFKNDKHYKLQELRPAAADQIPAECVHRVTEVRGFNDPQKEEYFRKRISDQILANNIITHLKALRSLYIMCHIPVFCWISATVLEGMLVEAESGEIPKTLTQMYTHFLIIQTNIIRKKFPKKQESDEEMLLKLGKLAFQQLMKGNLIFYEEDLRECGIDAEAAVYSETSILKELHLSVNTLDLSENQIAHSQIKSLSALLENPHCNVEILRLRKCGVSEEGCAVLSSALRSNPSHLRELDLSQNNLGDFGVKCLSTVLENPHCKLQTLRLCECNISDEGCAALANLRSNPSHLRELNLTSNNVGDPGVKCISDILGNPHCNLETLRLCMCGVSDEGCVALASSLRSNPSHLRVLYLSYNNIGDSGVRSLSTVLENPHCKLETLR